MKVAVAADHAGFPLKDRIIQSIREAGHSPIDFGTFSAEPVDYPEYVEKVGRAIQRGDAERAIILCGSGVGASIAANKLRGIRAGLCHDTYSAHQAVEHDDINVLTLGARVIGSELAAEIVRNFLEAKFSNEERHRRRLKKVMELEQKESAAEGS